MKKEDGKLEDLWNADWIDTKGIESGMRCERCGEGIYKEAIEVNGRPYHPICGSVEL